MLKLALLVLPFLTYAEWFLKTYETKVIYPLDNTRVSPVQAGEPRLHEKVLTTQDGENLVLWVAPPTTANTTILYLPGNAGNLALRRARFSFLLDQGLGVVALGYRGSSGSTGQPSEDALSKDGLLVFDSLSVLTGENNATIVLYGESLGTALAAKIATKRTVGAVILEAPFTSIPDIASIQYPDIDLSNVLTQIWDTSAIIADMKEPLLILHGTKDELVPFEQGKIIFNLAGSQQKWLFPLRGVGHQGTWTPEAQQAVNSFLDRL